MLVRSIQMPSNRCSLCIAQKCYMCYIWIMNRVITQRQLRNGSAQVLREVQAGQTLIVARSGVPIAEVRPVSTRRFVPRAAIAAAMERSPRVDGERFRSEIDAIVDQSVDG